MTVKVVVFVGVYNMQHNQIGVAEIIAFRTTRSEFVYKYPLEGLFIGTSVSHIALRLTFNDKALFDQYVANNQAIKYNDNLIDPSTGSRLYEVYFSFWPTTDMALSSLPSQLLTYQHDCEESALRTPMTYSSRFNRYLHPDKKTVSTLIPVLKYFFGHDIQLPPSIILHTSRLKGYLEKNYKKKPLEQKEHMLQIILEATQNYATAYENWCDALLAQQNAASSLFTSNSQLNKLTAITNAAKSVLFSAKQELKLDIETLLFPNGNISEASFMAELENFMTFGQPEVDSIYLPLVNKQGFAANLGLDLEPILQQIKNIADHPADFEYNLLNQNCATMIQQLLAKSVQDSNNIRLKSCFKSPWYVRLFKLPVSPAMVMQMSNSALANTEIIQANKLEIVNKPKLNLVSDSPVRCDSELLMPMPIPINLTSLYDAKVANRDVPATPHNSPKVKFKIIDMGSLT